MKSLTTTVLSRGSNFSRGVIETGFEQMDYENASDLTNDVIKKFDDIAKKNGSTAFLNADTSEVIGSIDENESFDYSEWINAAITFIINNN